jgi:hypothetical protein
MSLNITKMVERALNIIKDLWIKTTEITDNLLEVLFTKM